MKNAIITITDRNNYGNRLQNYALQRVLEKYGESCSLVEDIQLSAYGKVKRKIRKFVSFKLPNFASKRNPDYVRRTYFEKFSDAYINESKYMLKNGKIFEDINDSYDYFFVGSDQVWNPTFESIANNIDKYLLKFVNPKKRIAYAASFGVSELTKKWKLRFAKELLKFKAISVREEAGAKIVKELTGRDAEILIDPTMILEADTWRQVAQKAPNKKSKKTPYILKYFLGDQTEKRKAYIQSIADKNSLEVYELLDVNYPELYAVGPDGFLDLIDHAALICTDSFHAVAFSILFGKPFLVMNRTQENAINMSSRITTLLNKLHLERKMPGIIEENEIFECNYSKAYQVLQKERKRAYAFLKKALS